MIITNTRELHSGDEVDLVHNVAGDTFSGTLQRIVPDGMMFRLIFASMTFTVGSGDSSDYADWRLKEGRRGDDDLTIETTIETTIEQTTELTAQQYALLDAIRDIALDATTPEIAKVEISRPLTHATIQALGSSPTDTTALAAPGED